MELLKLFIFILKKICQNYTLQRFFENLYILLTVIFSYRDVLLYGMITIEHDTVRGMS